MLGFTQQTKIGSFGSKVQPIMPRYYVPKEMCVERAKVECLLYLKSI